MFAGQLVLDINAGLVVSGFQFERACTCFTFVGRCLRVCAAYVVAVVGVFFAVAGWFVLGGDVGVVRGG